MSETEGGLIHVQGREEEKMSNKNQDNTTCTQLWDDDIIDISELDLEDEETWLLKANTSELSFDIDTWLQKDSHKNNIVINDNDVGSTIDTRTFTRSKRKTAKLNIDSIRERTLSTLVYNDDNESSSATAAAAAAASSSSSWSKIKINWKEEEMRNRDCIPAMLRQSLLGTLSPTRINAQESLEAFLNMSQSKGIDSFINMAEPEFNESLINTSRPSFLHTTSSSGHSVDSTVGITNIGMADSQILTDSMMQTSIFNDVDDYIVNDNFSDDFDDNNLFNNTFNLQSEIMMINDGDDKTLTPVKFQGVLGISNVDIQQESFIVNKTYDRLSSEACTRLSDTITTIEDDLKIFNTTMGAIDCNKTFDSNSTFSKISHNTTFKADDDDEKNDIVKEEMNKNTSSSNSTYLTNNDDDDDEEEEEEEEEERNFKFQTDCPNNELSKVQNNEPKSLDMTYSKKHLERDDVIIENNLMLKKAKLSTDILPVNRYKTYRKSATVNKIDSVNRLANSITAKMSLNYDKNYQGKSMEMLNKVSSSSTPLYSQEIYTKKLNGPKGFLTRLPQTLQKSNPNLPSYNSTVITKDKTKKIIQQSKFGFQSVGRAILKNGQPILSHKCDEKLEIRNSNDSIESTLSTYSGPDFDDGLSTCSDGSHHLNCQQTSINSEQLYKVGHMQEEKLKEESTPKSDRKIFDNTWIASKENLPSPILKKNNEIIGKQVSCCSNNIDSEIQTSSPILSPAESLQSLPSNEENHVVNEERKIIIIKQQESLPLNKLLPVLKPPLLPPPPPPPPPPLLDAGVRLPINRTSNLPSGIPRPASRIPAPRFSRTNAQIKSQHSLKKNLF